MASLFAGTVAICGIVSGQVPDTLRHSIFAPKTLPQEFERQGASVAVSGGLAVVGCPHYDRDPVSGLDSGAVKIFDTVTGKLLHQLQSPSGTAFEYFGQAVAISGSIVVVGAGTEVAGQPYAGSVLIFDLGSSTPTTPVLTLSNPAPAVYDLFGHSVAVDGDRVVVGAWLDDTDDVDAGLVYVYDLSSLTPEVPVLSLPNPDPAEGDCFGVAVATSGDRVAVAAYLDDTGASNAGRVYVYDVESPAPEVPVEILAKPAAQTNDCFGSALAMSGDLVLVGAECSDAGGLNSGNAFVFNLAAGTPEDPVVILANPIPQVNGYFGNSVGLSGSMAVIGAYRDDTGAPNAGICYAYDLAGGTPAVPLATLQKPAASEADYFANAVAISGMTILSAASNDDTGAAEAGSSFIYSLSSPTPGTPVAALTSPLGNSVDRFGTAVAVDGDMVVVGSPGSDAGAAGAGQVTVHDLSASKPTAVMAALANPDATLNDEFGAAVAVDGTLVVVGAPGDDSGATDAGTVYVFDLTTLPTSGPLHVIHNPAPGAGDRFGNAVSISGTLMVIGCASDDAGAADSGSAYAFDLASPTPTAPVTTLTNPGPAAGDRFGASVSVSGTRAVVGAPEDDGGSANAGTAYVFALAAGTPEVPLWTLANPTPQANDLHGIAVGISGDLVAVGASGNDTGATNSGAVQVYRIDGPTPTVPLHTLLNPTPAAEDRFGHAVAVGEPRVVVGAYLDDDQTDSGRSFSFNMTSPTPTVPSALQKKGTPQSGDQFGTSVAVSGSIVVVGTPSDNKTTPDKGAAYVFGPAAPEIALEDPNGIELLIGGAADFGPVAIGDNPGGLMTFKLLNTGITGLAVTDISSVGGDASDFIVSLTGTSSLVSPDGSTTFAVALNPSLPGSRTTTLRIVSSDADENPFDITLTGHALSAGDDSDSDGVNDVAELRMASLGFDWQVANPELAEAFQTTSDAAGFFNPARVQALRVLTPALSRNPGTGQTKLTISLLKSTDLLNYQPWPLDIPQLQLNPAGEIELNYLVPDDAAFYRIETK